MLKELRDLLNRENDLEEADIKKASSMLLHHNYLYFSDSRQRAHYQIVSRYRSYFDNLVEALGMRLIVDDEYRFVGVLPTIVLHQLKLEETLLIIILLVLYDEEVQKLQLFEGVAVTNTRLLMTRYEQLTGRPFPKSSILRQRLALFQKHGIIKYTAQGDDEGEIDIKILPSITFVVDKARLEAVNSYVTSTQLEDEMINLTESNEEEGINNANT